ncbi:MAG: hypothetical protein KDA93_01755 [Planctomycetaceae bacterium]|nr:hypothetical protein [Planctomycetaceae bacterium]
MPYSPIPVILHGRILMLALFACGPVAISGCSAVMAARAPVKKDLSVLTPGIPRGRVISELGAPVHTHHQQGQEVDVFAFKQGYKTSTRYSRAFFHGVADVFTYGLWEIVGTPLEGTMQGEEVRAEVAYTPDGTIDRIEYYSGAHLSYGGPTLASWMRSKETRQTAIVEGSTGAPEQTILPASGESDTAPCITDGF